MHESAAFYKYGMKSYEDGFRNPDTLRIAKVVQRTRQPSRWKDPRRGYLTFDSCRHVAFSV